MKDSLRENLSYFDLCTKMYKAKRQVKTEKIVNPLNNEKVKIKSVSYGNNKCQYFLYYEPGKVLSDKVIIWVHGGGWNAGSPRYFDFVGRKMAKYGYRFISIGYRLSPKHKYPSQIEDVCLGYKAALEFLKGKGVDVSKIVVSGPSAGAHLTSILVYNKEMQDRMKVDVSGIIGYIGVGGPYSFETRTTTAVKLLLDQLFEKGYDRKQGEPCNLLDKSNIPMLLIQSRHDGLIDYSCAQMFYEKALKLGINSELYDVEDSKNTHSYYTAGIFLEERDNNKTLDKFMTWIEEL